jgi:DNA polymerase-4
VVRKIIHIDMDAFYASVEQRDNPAYRGRALVVGGPPDSRGVVAAASYEARRYGVRSAMPCAQAARLCPDLLFVRPRFPVYREVSGQLMALLREYSDVVEPLSLDEAYVDVTTNKQGIPSATAVAEAIRQTLVARTQLTASAGVAPNKFLAKIASDMNKPNGLTVIAPHQVARVLDTLAGRKVPGIGEVTEHKMAALQIVTLRDLRTRSEVELVRHFGSVGRWYHQIARGIDERPVVPNRRRKSIGTEETFPHDITDLPCLFEHLETLVAQLWQRLEKAQVQGRTITVKVTYADFVKITRRKTLNSPVTTTTRLCDIARSLLDTTEAGTRPVRLLGVTMSHFGLPASESALAGGQLQQLSLPFAGHVNGSV